TAVVGVNTDVGGGKYLLVAANDPYLAAHGHPGSVSIGDYLLWHAIQAYTPVVPAGTVNPQGTTGFVFAPIPINPLLWNVMASPAIDAALIRYPIFLNGEIAFDRWIHLDIAVAENDLEVGI